jgi:hypothetical protein
MDPHESPLADMMPAVENNGARSLWKMPSWTAEELGLSVDLPQLVVPITCGLCARKEDAPTVFVCFAVVSRNAFLYSQRGADTSFRAVAQGRDHAGTRVCSSGCSEEER